MRRATHEERLLLAGQIRTELKDYLGDGLRAFVIFASTAKKQDGPYSDLEMMAIISDEYAEGACGFMRHGIYCEVYYVPYPVALKKAREVNRDWPVSADQWHRMIPIYIRQGDDCLGFIQTAAWQSLNYEDKFHQQAAGSMLGVQEEMGSLVNAWEKGIASDICTQLYNVSVCVVYLMSFVNRHFYPSLRNAWEESKKLDKLPRDYVRLIEMIHGERETRLESRYVASMELWQNLKDWMRELGIDWLGHGRFKLPKKIK